MSDKNIAIVQQIYQAFGRGDVPGILEHIADDMRGFGVVSESTEVPWHLQITRKADVPKFFQALATECEFTKFEPHSFALGGDHVYCSVDFDCTMRRTGKKVTMRDSMHRFTIRNGRVVEWRGTEDTDRVRKALLA